MNDHAPRIRAQQQALKENEIIADLEQRAAPLHYALILAVLALCLTGIVEQSRDFIQRYTDLAAQEEAMIQCLNGRMLKIDSAIVQCQVHEISLVAEMGTAP